MNESLLRKYVKSVLVNEGMYVRSGSEDTEKPRAGGRGWLDKIKSFFAGTSDVDDLAQSWLEEQELYYDVDFSDSMQDDVIAYARFKFPKILNRARGDKAKAASLTRKAMSVRFAPQIREIERDLRRREESEDEEIYK